MEKTLYRFCKRLSGCLLCLYFASCGRPSWFWSLVLVKLFKDLKKCSPRCKLKKADVPKPINTITQTSDITFRLATVPLASLTHKIQVKEPSM